MKENVENQRNTSGAGTSGIFFNIRSSITDILFAILINSKYTRQKLNLIAIFIISIVIRNIVDIVIYILISGSNTFINFAISIIITVSLSIIWEYAELCIFKFKDDIQKLTNYILDNYEYELYKKWRKRFIITMCLLLCSYSYIIEITSALFRECIYRFLITYYIIDKIEDYYLKKGWIGKLREYFEKWRNKPSVKIYKNLKTIEQSYYSDNCKNSIHNSSINISRNHPTIINGQNIHIFDDYYK